MKSENDNWLNGLALRVKMPDGSVWEVPAEVIAVSRAEYYEEDHGGDFMTSLNEDTIPFFKASPDKIAEWAEGDMNWEDVEDVAVRVVGPDECDYQRGWINGEKRLIRNGK